MKDSIQGPAYRIETPRLVIRCWNPGDALLLHKAIQDSVRHLLPWMPWANQEPVSLSERIQLLRHFRSNFDQDKDWIFGIFDAEENIVVGGTGFHPRVGPQAIEIGYWIHVDHVGKGLATEATHALTHVGFNVNKYQRIEIHCDPENQASAAIPERLGYTCEGTLRNRFPNGQGQLRDQMIWSVLPDEWKSRPQELEIKAFDAAGRKLL